VESLMDDGSTVVVSGQLTSDMPLVVRGPTSLTEGQRVEVQEEH
jgi:hypothetical protein